MGENKTEVKLLSVDEILECPDLEERIVPVPQWKGSVKVRGFTKAQQQQIRKDAKHQDKIDADRVEMLMFIRGVIEPKFDEETYERLREKSAEAIDTVLKAIIGASGISEEAMKEAEATFL